MNTKFQSFLMILMGVVCVSGVLYYKYKPATSEEVADYMIEESGGLNGDDNQWKSRLNPLPLSQAAIANNVEVLGVLIKQGAQINRRDKYGDELTPLLWASVYGSNDAALTLLRHGAEIEMDDVKGKTPLIISAMKGNTQMVRLLLDSGANINASDDERMTALAWACKKGHIAVVQLLLSRKAAADELDIHGRSPLTWACLEGYWEIADLLIKEGVNINSEDEYGASPLVGACMRGNRDFVKKLIQKGADLSKIPQVYDKKINSYINKHK